MAPLVLEGETLSQKHRHYNGLVKAAVADQSRGVEPIDYSAPDADNLLRIDVACARRDLGYVLEVLRCPDLLYATRAIKRSTWLITDDQYAHIINPNYLEKELFPNLTAKVKSKLVFAIKQNLKDETRFDNFFNYYNENDPNTAMQWLAGCSIDTIEKTIKRNPQGFSSNQIKRLCRKSITILKVYCDQEYADYKHDVLQNSTSYLSTHCDEILDMIETLPYYYKPAFKKNATQIIMNKCRERVISNFEKYNRILHTPTFAENLKPEEVKDVLLKQKMNPELKQWVKYENVRHFLKHIPKDQRLDFIKSLFLSKENAQDGDFLRDTEFSTEYYSNEPVFCSMAMRSCVKKRKSAPRTRVSNAHIYKWYRYLPFHTAFTELKKLIYSEPIPAERNAILTVLIKCARSNQQNLQTVLEYYRNKHVNEPFNFKVQFVNSFLSHANTHEFDETTWNILNNLFSSMEVYMESDNNVPFCINAIIIYKLVHDQAIPEIIEKKFTFNTLKDYRKKLNENQQNKVFNYLYDYLMKTLDSQAIASESDLMESTENLCNMLNLLQDWNKTIVDYPFIISKIEDLVSIKRKNSWNFDFSNIYNAAKSWRKHLFEHSLVLHPSEEACLNALKHDPKLMSRYQSEVELVRLNDPYTINRVLRKIRIYWPDSIAQEWADYYFERIEQPKGRQAVKYICIIVPRHKILPLIKENAPIESKIDWNNSLETKLNLRNNIAKFMHLVRPSVELDTVLLYAKGDYLYHAMPSVNAVLYNMSSNVTSENITKLLDAPVSLQKHGICTIFKKLKYNDIKEVVAKLWKNNKNSSIKTILFQQTFKLLCNEKNEKTINDLWHLFSTYIDSLTPEENAVIYHTFDKFKNVPISVRAQFFMKGYRYLKTVTAKANADKILANLFYEATDLIGLLEPSFVEEVLLEKLTEKFFTKSYTDLGTHIDILTLYILSCKNEAEQILRYEKLLLPLLQRSFASWKLRSKGKYYIKKRCQELLQGLTSNLSRINPVKENYIPTKLFKTLQTVLCTSLAKEENFEILMSWSFTTLFVEILDDFWKKNPQILKEKEESTKNASLIPKPYDSTSDNTKLWENLCAKVAVSFGEACTTKLNGDSLFTQYPTLQTCVRQILRDLLSNLGFTDESKMEFLKAMLTDKDSSSIHCMVINMMPSIYDSKEVKSLKKEVLNILRLNKSTDVKINVRYYENNDLCSDSEDEEQNKNE